MTSRSSSRHSSEPGEIDLSDVNQDDSMVFKRARLSTSSLTPSENIVNERNNDDDDDDEQKDRWANECKFNKDLFDVPTWSTFKLSAKDDFKWKNLSKDAQNLCVKTLVRFFLFRASKNEIITRTAIAEQLTKAGNESTNFRNHASAAKYFANEILEREFGFTVVNASDIIGYNDDKSNEKSNEKVERNNNYFIVNKMTSSPRLLHALVDSRHKDSALIGFMYTVFTIIFVSENNLVRVEDLRRELRIIDDRFLQTASKSTRVAGATVAVPELNEELEGLIARMRKEGYLTLVKDEDATDDPEKAVYTFGPRFLAEIGHYRLAHWYFAAVGEVPDPTVLAEIRKVFLSLCIFLFVFMDPIVF